MDTELMIELFGYLGSALVVVSMLMASVVKLRLINTVGSIISGSYALIIGSFPLALMNICLIIINVYNLVKLLKTRNQYDMVQAEAGDSLVEYFVKYFGDDIRYFFPGFDFEHDDCDAIYMVFCSGSPAGLLLGKFLDESTVELELDYSVPAYRDCSVGSFLYSKLPELGVTKLVARPDHSRMHIDYMEKMGFGKTDGVYVKKLVK